MPEEKQRKKRIRVEKLDEWIEILKLIERVNRDSEYFKQNAMRSKQHSFLLMITCQRLQAFQHHYYRA